MPICWARLTHAYRIAHENNYSIFNRMIELSTANIDMTQP